VIYQWLGSGDIGTRKHFLQVLDDHFVKAVHIPVQYNAAMRRKGQSGEKPGHNRPLVLQSIATSWKRIMKLHPEGLEPPTLGSEGGTESSSKMLSSSVTLQRLQQNNVFRNRMQSDAKSCRE